MSKSHPLPSITEKNQVHDKSLSRHTRSAKRSFKKDAPKTLFEKRLASTVRWLHIYLSMVSFAILLFFAVTGLALNHAEWFADQQHTTQQKGKLQLKWVNNPDTAKVAKLEIVEYLRHTHGIKGYLSDFRIDGTECSVSFKGPGYTSDTFISRETGEYDLSETRMGIMAVMNDLHKGRDSGSAWSKVIDASAILMTIVALSGIILVCFIKRRRLSGLIIAVTG
ncbi:MAG TPA: peptidase, partial [Sphingobacteriaceae bacterium]|nr:peptidase [Sphingobacteriaceae bacterium]